MRIIIIGAGRVGLGALGVALVSQGHDVVFAARREAVVNSINQHGYDVVTKGTVEARIEIRGVRAVMMPGEAFAGEVAKADQIYTSVRPDNLPELATILAEAILHRIRSGVKHPLDIFCCENLKNAGSQIERLVFANIPFQFAQAVQDGVGFNAAISDRIVSGQEFEATGRMLITADAGGDVLFDTLQVKGEFDCQPPFKGVDNFPASIEEKLYILNCGHAVCAYMGFQKGYQYIHEAMADETIHRAVIGAMLEGQRALHCKHGRTLHYGNLINELLVSFSNAALMDTIARVGRDPVRKLQSDDRLIGPAKLAYRYGIEPTYLIQGCAAALSFEQAGDAQSAELQKLVKQRGADHALDFVSQLRTWNPISKLIREEMKRQTTN
ncbi:MAG: 2-dehydropantoate 2-reductase N-terminal domain-containing protein [Acidobacteriota bacterium]